MINTNALIRLNSYRKIANESKYGSKDWRQCRWNKPKFLTHNRPNSYSDDRKAVYFDSLDCVPLIQVGEAYSLARFDHTGWYADHYQDNLIKGFVFSYRNANGEKAFIPAITWTNCDGITLYPTYSYNDTRDCAYRADRLAEIAADEEREDQAQWQAKNDIEELRTELHDLNKELLPLIKEIKAQRDSTTPKICQALRNTIEESLEERTRIFDRIERLTDNFWIAVEGF